MNFTKGVIVGVIITLSVIGLIFGIDKITESKTELVVGTVEKKEIMDKGEKFIIDIRTSEDKKMSLILIDGPAVKHASGKFAPALYNKLEENKTYNFEVEDGYLLNIK